VRSLDIKTDGERDLVCRRHDMLTPHRRTSFFLMGFYTLSLVCAVLIIQFGVEPGLQQDNKLPSKSLRGMFVLASAGKSGHATIT
jgi:hypothetical protein